MQIINDNLSEPLYQAILRWQKSYQRSGYLSTTSCLQPPRITHLEKRHDERIIVTASSLLDAFIGGACHAAIDGADDKAIHEEEYTTTIEGKLFSGRPDIIRHECDCLEVGDFKFTKTGSYTRTEGLGKNEWKWQANINAWLARISGLDVRKSWVELIFTDWKRMEAARDYSYPRRVVRLYPEMLPDEEVRQFVQQRVRLHLDTEALPDGDLPRCTSEEQWAIGDTWAVMKDGGARAIKGGVCDSEEEAKKLLRAQGGGHFIQHRIGKRIRCEDYCNAKDFCNQYVEEKCV